MCYQVKDNIMLINIELGNDVFQLGIEQENLNESRRRLIYVNDNFRKIN